MSRARRRSRRAATRADTSSPKRTCANETRLVFGLASLRDAVASGPRKTHQLSSEATRAGADGAPRTPCTTATTLSMGLSNRRLLSKRLAHASLDNAEREWSKAPRLGSNKRAVEVYHLGAPAGGGLC